jgi:hypothetical protein
MLENSPPTGTADNVSNVRKTSSREFALARTVNPSNAVVEAETPSSLLVALKVALSSSGRQSRRREERTGLPPRTSSSDGKQHCVAACLLGTPSFNSVFHLYDGVDVRRSSTRCRCRSPVSVVAAAAARHRC